MSSTGVRAPRSSLLADLRAATHESHQRLERRLDLEQHPTIEGYRLFVRATSAVVAPLEASLAAWLGPLFVAPEPGTRMDRLRADLSHLDSDIVPAGAPGIAPAGSLAEAFGAAYVLQGSLLGGAVIARLVHSRLGVGEGGTTYVRLYGDGLARAWRQFTSALEEFGTHGSDADRQVVLSTAGATFDGFGAALEREGLTIG